MLSSQTIYFVSHAVVAKGFITSFSKVTSSYPKLKTSVRELCITSLVSRVEKEKPRSTLMSQAIIARKNSTFY